jgi:hypothetical protein
MVVEAGSESGDQNMAAAGGKSGSPDWIDGWRVEPM